METTIPFMGFYNSIHDAELDQALDMTFSNDRGDVISSLRDRAFDKVNWSDVHTEYAETFAEIFADKFGIKTLRFKLLSSPKFYNFETDRIFVDIDLNELQTIFKKTPTSLLESKIKENFTSCSGFISFYSNDLSKWPDSLQEWDHNQLGTLIQAYIESHDEYSDDWEISILEELSEPAYIMIDKHMHDEKLWKIYNYLREREERKHI